VPTVVVSTVDQVGSRLLFRGYGVSRALRPVHAGLLGNDVLFVLDEVHLARPFAQTLAALRRRYRGDVQPDRWAVVELSATPTTTPRRVFALNDEDRQSATLGRRLRAQKPVATRLARAASTDQAAQRTALATAAVTAARELMERPGIRTVGVVVNRVDTAVAVHRAWSGSEAVLLTGRMRPLDRDRITTRYRDRLRTGRPRPDDEPLLVVATQAVEAGADLDLDALVSECAPLDALIQRFGRVDRDGQLTEAKLSTRSVVLATPVQTKADDPIYGPALRNTWAWLNDTIDFGPDRFAITAPLRDAAVRAALTTPTGGAPHLLPSHLDRWVQTSHLPDADPVPEFWLHGLREQTAEVALVWRADLPADLLTDSGTDIIRLQSLIDACPPAPGELMSVPLMAVRRWLSGAAVTTVSDTVLDLPAESAGDIGDHWRPALVVDGENTRVARRPGDVPPNATLVVPSSYGGVSAGTWDPTSTDPVPDLGTQAHLDRGDAILRLSPELLGPVPTADPDDQPNATETQRSLRHWLEQADITRYDEPTTRAIARLIRAGRRMQVIVVDAADGGQRYVLVDRGRGGDTEPATSSFNGSAVPLADHLGDVERWARGLADACGVPPRLREDLALAAALHDLGKADPRFQRLLRSGAPTTVAGLLAKSGLPAADYRARRRAQLASGYPAGTRHELTSVALVADEPWFHEQAHDPDLVLHLIATHHGEARPFAPAPADAPAVQIDLDHRGHSLSTSSDHGLVSPAGGVPDRFWRCVRRYGWHGLAWLEALLRLADHRASQEAE
jgi:CRISPR-associated endonuclease/helicase Cas3